MPGNLKNRARTEPSIGTVNTDLTRTTPLADPRFVAEKDELLEDQEPRLVVTKTGAELKITVPHQKLPDLPKAKGTMPFTAHPRSRT
jgi:hypothetical protein